MYNKKPCGRPLWDDSFCLFHSRNIEGKKKEFKEKFWKEYSRILKEEEVYDFTGFVFPINCYFILHNFNKDIYFRRAIFAGEWTDFNEVQFTGKVTSFCGAKFIGKYTSFLKVKFTGELTSFKEAQFMSEWTSFKEVQFTGKSITFSKCFLKNIENLFETLRNNLPKRLIKGKYKIKDFRFHLGQKPAKEYPVIDRLTKDAWYIDDFKRQHVIIYWIWKILADCGRSFSRWTLWSILIAIGFAFTYISLGSEAFKITSNLPHSFEVMLYYSVVTFTTLGFGDITPQTIEASRWVMAEVILGYIMLGGLISILANKLARRS